VRVLADTSVLVAAMVAVHPHHGRALPWLQRAVAGDIELVVCVHSLLESYAVLSTLPLRPRIRPDTARRLVRDNIERTATIVELDLADYRAILDDMSAMVLGGGVIYDALAARAAHKSAVDRLITLNPTDFRRVWPEGADRVIEP
jgi:predicted nucleic acid-binding protein